MSSVTVFASGKGGVGKSTVTANLATLLARAGYTVALVDTDIGLRSLDALLGLENRVVFDLVDVARGRCLLSQALLSDLALPRLKLLPAAQFARARDLTPKALRRMLGLLRLNFDFVLIDCPAGIERGLRNVLNAGADETVLVLTPDDLCIRDAERTCGLMDQKHLPRPRLIVNRLQNDLITGGAMYSAQTIAQTLDLPLLGEIPEDAAMLLAQLRHQLVIDYRCEARQALLRIAARMAGASVPLPAYGAQKTRFLRRHFPRKPVYEPLHTVRLFPEPPAPVSAVPARQPAQPRQSAHFWQSAQNRQPAAQSWQPAQDWQPALDQQPAPVSPASGPDITASGLGTPVPGPGTPASGLSSPLPGPAETETEPEPTLSFEEPPLLIGETPLPEKDSASALKGDD